MKLDFVVVLLLLVASAIAKEDSLSRGDWVLTPGGYRHRSCAHGVPSGSHIERVKETRTLRIHPPNGESYELPRCKFPTTEFRKKLAKLNDTFEGGWQAYTKQNVGNGMNAILGQWNVPDLPTNYKEQTLFLFTGMQNIDWVPPNPGPDNYFDIIQPVLQYGPSSAGGGNYWTLASWYVPLGGWFDDAVWSTLINVNAGDTIFGNISRVGSEKWYINSVDTTSKQNTDLTIGDDSRLDFQPWAYVTLEAYANYDSLTCDQYPKTPVQFTNLKLFVNGTQTPFSWTVENPFSTCNQKAAIQSASSVVINW